METKSFSQLPLLPDSFGFLREELALPFLICCELSRLRCHGHSLLLSFYLCRIKRKQNLHAAPVDTLCRVQLTSSLTVPHPSLSGVPSSALLPFLPLVQTLGRGSTVGSPWSSSTPPSLGRDRVTPPPILLRSYPLEKRTKNKILQVVNYLD